MLILSAIFVGFVGSFHCVGMCGPIMLALPGKQGKQATFVAGRFLYQVGRTLSYMLLGGIMGLLGTGFQAAGLQQALSIALGIGLLAVLLYPRWEQALLRIPPVKTALTRLRIRMGKLLRRHHLPTLFNLGILNGFLPCGFVYVALAGALATGDLLTGMAYMGLFGLGTYPAMLGMSLIGRKLPRHWTKGAQPWLQGMAVLLTLWLIIRGLDLGIPYLSPDLGPTEVGECH